ncbi:DUF3304 domain-containing protein [Janthinobacterium sp. 1_2014MBL_MicDiv]|uniref:DUF3304 domain-containing protein n=1 Tax=Janthinobacterium sp. 1_2014MBL_MicDiv TaxID=1644131 RepID=UPI0009F48143|nr:DUF3304 domain-containing protein [Janthinobacterium sp. 1_2014MBL_MicDiv]
MMIVRTAAGAGWRALAMGVLLLPMLSACADKNVPVSIHGVNYSGEVFRYAIVDPANKDNAGGGETIDPYAAGGTMCCYDLPRRWRPGIQVQVDATYWLPRKADGSLPEVKQTQVLEVPAYADGKPGELWVLRGADGKLAIISSDYQPDHASWPGKVKGWPLPSLEYRREKWDAYIQHEEGGVELWEKLLEQMRLAPLKHAREVWESERKSDPKAFSDYTGPDDTRFHAYLRADYARLLAGSRSKLEQLKKERP